MKKSGCCPKCGHHDILYVPAKGIYRRNAYQDIINITFFRLFSKHIFTVTEVFSAGKPYRQYARQIYGF